MFVGALDNLLCGEDMLKGTFQTLSRILTRMTILRTKLLLATNAMAFSCKIPKQMITWSKNSTSVVAIVLDS